MEPYATGPGWELLHGDCIEAMRGMAEASVDAIVCDPPYDLTGVSRNGSPRQNDPATPYGRTRLGGGFMGKTWDATGIAFDPATWAEALRVLKPGGHLLAFGGTRTYHRLACAIEDAGFEVRDQLQWLYGSGFPKSLDVSKAIDKAAGAEREVTDYKPRPDGTPRNHEQWATVPGGGARVCRQGGAERPRLDSLPATPEAAAWNGWGTALKPSHEPICLARKPLAEGTVAANVLAWGTGGINVDGCRIGTDERTYGMSGAPGGNGVRLHGGDGRDAENARRYACESKSKPPVTITGRWPANVCLDEEAAALLDEQAGVRKSGARSGHYPRTNGAHEYGFTGDDAPLAGSTGGASRFFYCAKASRSERNAGLEGMPERVRLRADLSLAQREHVLQQLAAQGVAL